MSGLDACFADLKDPRGIAPRRHNLMEILTIALCAVLSGAETAVDMAVFAEAKHQFLGQFLDLKNGVPSHDTFSRVFRRLDPEQFRACFQKFVATFGDSRGGVIAIDGKVLRRSLNRSTARSALRIVSAWCCDRRLVLGQIATTAKSRESASVLKLLQMLVLDGSIVTADALNCRRQIAWQITRRGGDYVLALKANQAALHADVRTLFDEPPAAAAIDSHSTIDRNHGRIEHRTSLVSTDIDALQRKYLWPGLAAVGRVVRSRRKTGMAAGGASTEIAHYLLSAPLSAERLGQVVRSHWGVENRLHWVLNVAMNEDQGRSRLDNSPYNLAILRHMALNLMQRDHSRVSLRGKFNLAAWKDDFLAELLTRV